MARLAVLLAITILSYLLWQELKKADPKRRRQLLLRGGVIGLVGVVIILAVTGRIHWLMAAAAAMIPLAKTLFALLLRSFPFLQVWLKHKEKNHSGQPSSPNTTELTEDEALQILGLEPGASDDDIILAHKRLIQKLHPDRGGNDYLAAKLNAARDLLIGKPR